MRAYVTGALIAELRSRYEPKPMPLGDTGDSGADLPGYAELLLHEIEVLERDARRAGRQLGLREGFRAGLAHAISRRPKRWSPGVAEWSVLLGYLALFAWLA